MNNEGFGINGVPFEYTVEKKGKKMKNRKIFLMLAYVAWVILFFSVGAIVKLILPMLCFIPLSVWFIAWLTWRYTKEEIKITLFGGTMTITRQYDGKNAKKIAETKIKDIETLEQYSASALEANNKENMIYAVQNQELDGSYILTWQNTTLVMETNEKAMKIIKYYNSALFDKKL